MRSKYVYMQTLHLPLSKSQHLLCETENLSWTSIIIKKFDYSYGSYHFLMPKPDMQTLSKVGDCSQGRHEGSLFNSYYTEV